MTIMLLSAGVAVPLPIISVNDDDWYLYDQEQDLVVEHRSHRYEPDHTQTPRGLEWLRGMSLKLKR